MHLMKRYLPLVAIAALCASLPLLAQEAKTFPAPSEIVAAAKADEWVAIAPSDLMIMDLAPDSKGRPRRVVIQLIPEPFSQGWVGNIRKLAAAKFWDGTSINRVQDNYVVQWGDATEKKALPNGLAVVSESEYRYHLATIPLEDDDKPAPPMHQEAVRFIMRLFALEQSDDYVVKESPWSYVDTPSLIDNFLNGWPVSLQVPRAREEWNFAPIHCYGMVGVGRNLSPDTGSGAELYSVIGHAPRHLDRNIALVGRVIEGIEHMSSLPRGTGALGFYETAEERVPILSVRLGNEATDVPTFESLSTKSESFAAYADARANRREPFFNKPENGTDICNIPVPIRRKAA